MWPGEAEERGASGDRPTGCARMDFVFAKTGWEERAEESIAWLVDDCEEEPKVLRKTRYCTVSKGSYDGDGPGLMDPTCLNCLMEMLTVSSPPWQVSVFTTL